MGWDEPYWGRPYMAERALAAQRRDGMECPAPCSELLYQVSEPSVTGDLWK